MKANNEYDEDDDYSKTMGPEIDSEDETDEWEPDDWELDEESDDE